MTWQAALSTSTFHSDNGPIYLRITIGVKFFFTVRLATRHPDELVRLGRVTEWMDLDNDLQAPVGGKMLLVDDEEFPLLEVRQLEIEGPSATPG